MGRDYGNTVAVPGRLVMTKKWIAINLLLLLIAAIAGRQLYVSVHEFDAENDLSKIQPDRSLNQKIAQETTLPPPLANPFTPILRCRIVKGHLLYPNIL